MIWNTIVHPKMMIDNGTAALGLAPGSVAEGIKYADPHKLAFFDLLVDASDGDNPKLIHGDFETVKKKLFNHEFVVGGIVFHEDSADLHEVSIEIYMVTRVAYNYTEDAIVLIADGSVSLLPDNTVRNGIPGQAPGGIIGPNPGGGGSGGGSAPSK